MAYCVKCGAKVDDGTMSCPQCGAPIPELAGGRSDSRTAGSMADYSQSGGQEYTYGQGYTYNQSNGSGTAGYAQEPYGSYGYGSYGYGSQAYFDRSEVSRNKAMGVLSYIGILVLIPLIAGDKQSQYVKQHVNQGLILYILSKIIDFIEGDWFWGIHSFFHFGGNLFSWAFDIIDLALLILLIMGIVTACRGERRELPFIGKIKFFK